MNRKNMWNQYREREGEIHSKRRNLISQELNKEVFFHLSPHFISFFCSFLFKFISRVLSAVSLLSPLRIICSLTLSLSIQLLNTLFESRLHDEILLLLLSNVYRYISMDFHWNRNFFLKLQTIANKKNIGFHGKRDTVEGIRAHH